MQPAASTLSQQAEIAKTMQPHSAQNMYVSAGNNSSGNARTNPQTSIFRGPQPASNAPRGAGARHLHMQTMYTQPMHQMVPAYTQFTPRQPTFPAPHIQYAPAPLPTYYPYQYLQTLQQQPTHSRSGVAVNASLNVGNAMPVQSAPNGPLAGPGASSTQLQMLTGAVQPGGNAVLGVGATGSGQVGVGPMVGVLPANVQPQPVQQTNRRRRQHRLQIIDPTTKKNILDDLDKGNTNADSDFQEQVPVAVIPKVPICISQPEPMPVEITRGMVITKKHDGGYNIVFHHCLEEQNPAQRTEMVVGQTPVVSARSDAPSVEIFPTPQKPKSKKIPIVSPKEESELSTVNAIWKVDDATADANTHAVGYRTTNPIQAIRQKLEQMNEELLARVGYVKYLPVEQQQTQLQSATLVPPAAAEETSGAGNDAELAKTTLKGTPSTEEKQARPEAAAATPVAAAAATAGDASDAVDVLVDSVETMHITQADTQHNAAVVATATAATVTATVASLPSDKVPAETILDAQASDLEQSVNQVDIRAAPAAVAAAAAVETPQTRPDIDTQSSTHESTPDETDRAALAAVAQQETQQEPLAAPAVMAAKEQTLSADQAPTESVAPAAASAAATTTAATETPGAESSLLQSLISYNEGQWSPNNPTGKRQYDRDQLIKLREAKASRVQPEVNNESIKPQANLMPSFVRGGNKRVQSMGGSGIGGGSGGGGGSVARNNDQGVSLGQGGKHISMSGMQARGSMKGMIHVNLSLNQDVKLNETENAWRPRVHVKTEVEGSVDSNRTQQEKDDLVRRVRGILNKLTPEKFDTLVEEIIKLKIDTPEKMDEVIVLVFEKAIDEPNFSVSYARLCQRLINEVKARDERMESGTRNNLAHFRNALLDKTEREFTHNVSQSTAKEKKLQPILDKIRSCTDQAELVDLQALLEEEERKIRRRSGGTVRFIGELFKISMLTGKIIYSCIDTLLNPQSEDMLECLCKLLTTVGAKFESTPVNTKEPLRMYSLEKSIAKMQAIASKTDKDVAKVSSRVRFMLQDVIDLRKNKWQTSRNEAPKTMGQIEKEAKNEQLSAQYMNYGGSLSSSGNNGPQSGGGGGGNKRDDRGGSGRYGDARSGYGGSHSQRGGGDSGGMRHQHQGGGGNSGGGGGNSSHSNGNNDDNTWHVQMGKGSRSQAVDTIKLEGLSLQLNQNLDTKKMGGASQFQWSTASRVNATPTTTPNSFAVLSLIDKNSTDRDRDRDRDRSGPRNKGSYNKGSMERDRYDRDRGMHSRTGSSQGSRENSSSRGSQQGRSMLNASLQKSASHSKYTQQAPQPTRLAGKGSLSSGTAGGMYRDQQPQQQQQSSGATAANSQTSAHNNAKAVAPPVAVFEEPSDSDLKLIKSVIAQMIETGGLTKQVTPDVVASIEHVPESQRCGFLYYILTDYLHLANVGKQCRRFLANTVAQIIQQNHMSADHFKLAYKEFSELANDLIVDIPELWLYVLQFAGPLIVKKILTVSDLWNKQLKDSSPTSMSKKFLKTYLTYCTREVGPNFTRSMWKKFNLRWSDFMPDNEVIDFIESNNLEYVENESKAPVIEPRESHEKHVKNVIEHIEHLLKEGATADCIIDYSNGNIVQADKLFIRGLTEKLSKFAIVYKDMSYKLESELFQRYCIPVFQRYIDSHEEHQLECLYAMQLLVHKLEHPRGLLCELFGELYDVFVIQKESLCKWRDSKDQSAGKGVAVKSLNPFFNSIFNDENN